MSKRMILLVLCLFDCSLLPADNLSAQAEPFYKGQTLRVIVAFTPGGAYDTWARMITKHLDKYIPGNPMIVVQNMPGAGSISAANYFTSVAKPDGLTIGLISSALYFDQLIGRKEVSFDWSKFTWIGTPERTSEMLYIRADAPFKTIEDLRQTTNPPKCGATGIGSTDYYFPKLSEDALGAKFNVVVGYQGAADIDLAVEKGEMHCRAGTLSSFFGREPGRTWTKTGFVRLLVQGAKKRDARSPDVPTIYELMEKYKTPDVIRRLAVVLLSPGDFGRPVIGPPGMSPERTRVLRDAFARTMNDPELLAEVKKREWEANGLPVEELEALAKEVVVQPPEVIERMKKLFAN
ncbi:MAG TPA: tripartite tricarboxylate transporter substrate-binding protein [Candidatus Acidoferrum sp.]|nr:tripartite tricarboxylate transporter substrate-binding protein [Candidatus Acidoferrum sp.]